ncbi:hypothetical protein L615_001000000130 [Nocardioides sp. J9]|uniref:hypothetical protein n=1 Tax=Nocardioides sp. J9 TaxID=935844 RepID=UPI0011A11D8F|nr:hypothetical protein [Nocardioides sp. J9]TWH04680.1 hypothetical protein L615_001000000130 [Nocardioides sp. J9]
MPPTQQPASAPGATAPAPQRADGVPVHTLAAFLAGVLLVLPTYGVLGVTSDAGLWGWFLGAIAAAAAVGGLLALLVRRALSLVLLATGGYVVVVLVGVFVVAGVGDPPGNGVVALLAGLPAAAVAAVAAAVTVQRTGDAAPVVAGVALLLLGLFGLALAPTAGSALDDARDDAAEVARLKASGLTPVLPEVDGFEPVYSSYRTTDGQVTEYGITYESDPDAVDPPRFTLDVTREPEQDMTCDRSEGAWYDCREGDGYHVLSRQGNDEYVVAERTGGSLVVWFSDGSGDLPDADELGRVLATAEPVEWEEIRDLE